MRTRTADQAEGRDWIDIILTPLVGIIRLIEMTCPAREEAR
jgi:hypothetical protein